MDDVFVDLILFFLSEWYVYVCVSVCVQFFSQFKLQCNCRAIPNVEPERINKGCFCWCFIIKVVFADAVSLFSRVPLLESCHNREFSNRDTKEIASRPLHIRKTQTAFGSCVRDAIYRIKREPQSLPQKRCIRQTWRQPWKWVLSAKTRVTWDKGSV